MDQKVHEGQPLELRSHGPREKKTYPCKPEDLKLRASPESRPFPQLRPQSQMFRFLPRSRGAADPLPMETRRSSVFDLACQAVESTPANSRPAIACWDETPRDECPQQGHRPVP